MKKRQDGWVSEYRRKKFLESRKKTFNNSLPYLNLEPLKFPTKIVVMLDLDGTVDGIDDEKSKVFLKQLDYIRKKFQADTGVISISTHYDNAEKIDSVLDILSRNLLPNIKIGMSFYYGGMYDYEKKLSIPCKMGFNRDKVATFDEYYINVGVTTKWMAIIDDSIDEDSYKKYQEILPMLLCKPSQNDKNVLKNNFMRRATTTNGFNGVLEVMDEYTESIRNLSFSQIVDYQRNMMTHLSSFDLVEKIRKRNYAYLERYFKEGYADDSDYEDTLSWILITNNNISPTKEELCILSRIFSFMIEHFEEQKEEKMKLKVLQYQKEMENSVNKKEN